MMIKRKVSFLITLIVISLSCKVFAQKTPAVKDIMDRVYYSFSNLLPYMASEMKFSDPSSKNTIKKIYLF